MKTTPQEERNGLNPCDCGESPVHSVNGHKIGGFKGNTPQEEWKDVLYKFTLGSLHLSLEKRHDWYKSFIKSEKEKSYLLGVGKEAMRNQDRYYRQGRQEVLREVRETLEKVDKEKWDDAEHCTCLGYALDLLSTLESKE